MVRRYLYVLLLSGEVTVSPPYVGDYRESQSLLRQSDDGRLSQRPVPQSKEYSVPVRTTVYSV